MATKYESYNGSNDITTNVWGDTWVAQTFTPSISHDITSVFLRLSREGNPGTVTVSIRATSAGLPTGGDLAVGTTNGDTLPTFPTPEDRETTFGASYQLNASTKYAIVWRCLTGDDSNQVHPLIDGSSPGYAGGSFISSSNGGSSWTADTANDFSFEEWGNPLGLADLKSVNAILKADIKSINGIPIADIKSVNGIT